MCNGHQTQVVNEQTIQRMTDWVPDRGWDVWHHEKLQLVEAKAITWPNPEISWQYDRFASKGQMRILSTSDTNWTANSQGRLPRRGLMDMKVRKSLDKRGILCYCEPTAFDPTLIDGVTDPFDDSTWNINDAFFSTSAFRERCKSNQSNISLIYFDLWSTWRQRQVFSKLWAHSKYMSMSSLPSFECPHFKTFIP